jgi:hypothetical protein
VPAGERSRYWPGHDSRIAPIVEQFAEERGIATVTELLRRYDELEAAIGERLNEQAPTT